jgi:hypothetical protein
MRIKFIGFLVIILVVGITIINIINPKKEVDEIQDARTYKKEPVTPIEFLEPPERGYLLGFLPTPYKGQSFDESYLMASETIEIVPIWGKPSPFYSLAEELKGSWGEIFLETFTRGNDMVSLIHLSFIDANLTLKTPLELDGSTLSDPEWRRTYRESAIDVVQAANPLYLSVGNEVNRWYEKFGMEGANGFKHWVSLYEEIYKNVKEISPETFVFCTFSREIVSENREADLEVINFFDPSKMDLLIVTSYPFALAKVNRPGDLPDDYFKQVSDLMPNAPFGFSEVAWPSMTEFGGEYGQAEFLEQLTGRLTIDNGLDLEFLMWNWMTDLGESDKTGLISWDGNEKAAYEFWQSLSKGS